MCVAGKVYETAQANTRDVDEEGAWTHVLVADECVGCECWGDRTYDAVGEDAASESAITGASIYVGNGW